MSAGEESGLVGLLTEFGAGVLDAATALQVSDPLRASAALGRSCPTATPELRAGALTQVALRRHAAERFGADAARMFFTRAGLEQCTRPTVADHRAASLRARAPDARTALDLCCGLGSDLIALARAGLAVTGIDRDPEALAAAGANLRALGLAGRLVEADVRSVDPGAADVIVADPARRTADGSRVRDPEQFGPPWSWVRSLLAHPGVRACVTTSPALAHSHVPPGCEAEWVDDAGSTVELAVWSPALTPPAIRRRATLLAADGSLSVTDADDGARDIPEVRDPRPGDWLLEPRGAILRAGLLGVLAARVAGSVPGPGIGYLLAGDASGAAGLATAFRVLEVLPLRRAVLRLRLRELAAGSVEILARGVRVEIAALRAEILTRGAGDVAVTLVLTRTRAGALALLVAR